MYCTLCNRGTHNVDTWPHLLATCKYPVINGPQIDRHNKTLFNIKEMPPNHHLARWKCLINSNPTFDSLSEYNAQPMHSPPPHTHTHIVNAYVTYTPTYSWSMTSLHMPRPLTPLQHLLPTIHWIYILP